MQVIPNQKDFFFALLPVKKQPQPCRRVAAKRNPKPIPCGLTPPGRGKGTCSALWGWFYRWEFAPEDLHHPTRGAGALSGDADSLWGLPKGWLLAGPRWSLGIEGVFPTDHPFPFVWWCKLRPQLVLKVGYAGKSTDHSRQTSLCKHFNWILMLAEHLWQSGSCIFYPFCTPGCVDKPWKKRTH